ncbi:hypothetical protein [Sphingomonas sp. BK580]|uniref:hypothetical protein n=1 Tax=Sphingomonas sp. BK580 TaxID=2586972 RepID=UPI001C84DFD9|nr:hypothetical protein [Sphingomonas sp. BK580]
MSPRSRRVVLELSPDILREAIEHRPEEDAGLRLALRCLMGLGVDRTLLTAFWEALRAEVDIGRRHGVERAFEAVRGAATAELA